MQFLSAPRAVGCIKREGVLFMSRYSVKTPVTIVLTMVMSSLLMLGGCATSKFDLDKDVFERQMQQVRLGMLFADFKALFPQTISRGGDRRPEGMVTAFEVAYDYYSFYDTGNELRNDATGTERVVTWFFFLDGRLVKYGKPEVWPSASEL